MFKFNKGETLGEWIGTTKFITKDKKIKTKKCSSLALKDYAVEVSENERNLIEEKLKAL